MLSGALFLLGLTSRRMGVFIKDTPIWVQLIARLEK
jgi:ribosomal protein L30/L7E